MEEDHISRLPDEILVSILSLLPVRDTVITSALSWRWRYIWTCTTNLTFDGQAQLLKKKVRRMGNFGKLNLERDRFINWVNGVINQHKGGQTDQFRVYFDLDDTGASSIDTWVKFAMGKPGLQNFTLEFPFPRSYHRFTIPYLLSQQVFSCPKNNYIAFQSLKVLCFMCVEMSDEVFHHLLSKCSLLERLEVHATKQLVNLRISGPSLALKHLELLYCMGIKSIEICDAENLVSFYCRSIRCDPMSLVIRNVPILVDVFVHFNTHRLGTSFNLLSCCLSQLQILQLDIALQNHVDGFVYPTLTNLKQLKLMLNRSDNTNVVKLIPFLKAFPYLNKLVLKMYAWKRERGEFLKATKCSHPYLKEVEVKGYTGHRNDAELITYIVENAVSLEKIIIKSFEYKKSGRSGPSRTMEDEEMARDHLMKHVKEKIPSTIEFICP